MIRIKIVRKTLEATDIFSYELQRLDGCPLPAYSAGSHVDVALPGGITRQYSLCGDAADARLYRIAVLRDPASRGGSVAMNDTVQEGDILEISEPRNHFHLVHAQRTLLFAGGIGVTPLLCMARRLHSIGADYEMHYCARSIARTAFRDEITASPMAGRVSFHFDDGPPESRLDLPAVMDRPHPGTHLYVCGPTGFIDWVVGTARGQGWSGDHVHVEHFGATPQDTHGDQAFQVKIASSGAVYDIPAGQSVAAALEQHGVAIQVSCEQGVCGTCLTRVLEGDCDHRDHYLTEEEKARNDQFTPCSSRARSKMLVLDL